MLLRKIDNDGFFVEDYILESIPVIKIQDGKEIADPYYIETLCPDGFYRPRWDGTQWIEALIQAEIDVINNVIPQPTQEERLQAVEDALLTVLLGGVI